MLARLHPQSPQFQKITDLLYRAEAGYAGEIKVDRFLEASDLPEPFRVFTDLQLSIHSNSSIQIDTLLVTPSYLLILEVKNIAGTLHYIQHPPHFECTYEDGKTIAIDCPMMQLENNKTALDLWLSRQGFAVRSTGLIVMANNNAIIKNAPEQMKMIHAKHLPHYFRTMESRKRILTDKQFQQLVERLHSAEPTYHPYPLLEKYRLNREHIRAGLICTYCHGKLDRMNHMSWKCSQCGQSANQPYKEGLQDWFMIMKNSITNKECREFLGLKDSDAARYILKSATLDKVGRSRSVQYVWDYRNSPSKLKE
ncbi:hypothetical protein HMPREF9372_1147 [Sporosarcina newyorkensis 2681]|uniref:NERD domain-containing protein n=1 Tax=Sporosarcina newyorkensis 2681 TaxID=1027292 RepID=F9DQR7_9BACL|nr:nuclease-related domain-containing protein [Sporosarcina newyorkensis]EGQ26875.1 hypothetical protein HMPREF9372_1147 [Sporosarcina newyorkensis 2681]